MGIGGHWTSKSGVTIELDSNIPYEVLRDVQNLVIAHAWGPIFHGSVVIDRSFDDPCVMYSVNDHLPGFKAVGVTGDTDAHTHDDKEKEIHDPHPVWNPTVVKAAAHLVSMVVRDIARRVHGLRISRIVGLHPDYVSACKEDLARVSIARGT
eukprot:3390050-Rhodomonas_salina.2